MQAPMSVSLHKAIITDILNFEGVSRNCEIFLQWKYKQIPQSTLGSIISHVYQSLMKQNYRKSLAISSKYYEAYKKSVDKGDKQNILLRLSEKQGLNPALYARSVLLHLHPEDTNTLKQRVRDTTLIEDKDLAYQVYLNVLYDNQYGPIADTVKQSIGMEYELRLERELRLLNISFSDEHVLRLKGYDKTPDFKLDIPIAVDGFIINWVESKALFGDEESHSGYLKDQLMCYWNRFGPGLVIYWFGYLESIENTPEVNNMFILRSNFPELYSVTLYKMNE